MKVTSCLSVTSHNVLPKLHLNEGQSHSDYLAYVDESISNILLSKLPHEFFDGVENEVEMIDSRGIIIWKSNSGEGSQQDRSLSMPLLVQLANQSECIIFREENKIYLPDQIRSLIYMATSENDEFIEHGGASPNVLIPALLALNMVESSIRNFCGKKHGKAPLLKDMIEIISLSDVENSESMAKLLRSVLLPNIGLSLRNLLWHGFIPALPRKWLSLSIVIILTLDHMAESSSFVSSDIDSQEYLKTLQQMREQNPLRKVIDHGKYILSSTDRLMKLQSDLIDIIVPPSHKDWLQISMKFVEHPVIFSSAITPFIEHLLRLYWCEANEMYVEAIAVQNDYYCTLDGAGQRNKHNIILLPTYTNQSGEEARSKLIDVIVNQSLSLITDLFASPHGPNIRSKASHGVLNHHLYNELSNVAQPFRRERDMQRISASDLNDDPLRDQTAALISTLDVILSFGPISKIRSNQHQNVPYFVKNYQPQYSYSGLLRRIMNESVEAFVRLHDFTFTKNITQNYVHEKFESTSQKIQSMSPTKDAIVLKYQYINTCIGASTKLFEESIEKAASSCGAATMLLSELSHAATDQMTLLYSALLELHSSEVQISTRRKKQIQRILSTAHLTLDFYSLAIFCALTYIEYQLKKIECKDADMCSQITSSILENSVRRSRMAVSTFVTSENIDRAIKAVSLYSDASCVKDISNGIAK
jgi:hypothetical protein